MALNFGHVLASGGIDPADALVLRHAYVGRHSDGMPGIHVDSPDEEILAYTSTQSADTRKFPATPARLWVVFLPEGGIARDSGRFSSTTARSPATASGVPSISNEPLLSRSWRAGSLSGGGHPGRGGSARRPRRRTRSWRSQTQNPFPSLASTR